MDPTQPRPLRRIALRAYAWLPRALRLLLVRRLTPDFTVGALCIIEHEGRVLMLRQRHRPGWTLPGGLLDRGEDALHCVQREVLEETGLVIRAAEPLTTVVDPHERRVDVIFHVPVVTVPHVVPSSEAVSAGWLLPTEIGAVDGPTVQAFAALVRARRPQARRGRLSG
ncbi:MAG: NUDIX domain-containing protein [Kineosporiaceae bacterium]